MTPRLRHPRRAPARSRHPGRPAARRAAALGLSLGALLAGGATLAPARSAAAQDAMALTPAAAAAVGSHVALAGGRLPFFAGEELVYRVQVARVGAAGRARMWVEESPATVRGVETLHLRFDFGARLGLVKAEDRTQSWLDPRRLAALRFEKRERHVLARRDHRVELDPAERRWTAADGRGGESPSDAPLDELSFMYVLRTLALGDDALVLARHFDALRNPIRVRVAGRRTLTTGAGTFRTLQVEMRVRDPERYRGEGVIRIDLTDDHCRIPVRIESVMPIVGAAVMTLESQNHPSTHHLARTN